MNAEQLKAWHTRNERIKFLRQGIARFNKAVAEIEEEKKGGQVK